MGNRMKIKPAKPKPSKERALDMLATLGELGNFVKRYNGYICEKCDKGYLTVDVDRGTTPIYQPCYATQGCTGIAQSMGYPEGQPPEFLGEPVIEWYRPDNDEVKVLAKKDPKLFQHAIGGGLLRRATSSAPDWVKDKARP